MRHYVTFERHLDDIIALKCTFFVIFLSDNVTFQWLIDR